MSRTSDEAEPLRDVNHAGMMDAVMLSAPEQQVDFIVVGGGVAGLRAAIELASQASVLLLAKDDPPEPAGRSASGAAFLPNVDDEGVNVLVEETVRHGDGLCRAGAVRALAEGGPGELRRLREWGAKLDEAPRASTVSAESAAKRHRAARSSIGMEIVTTLAARAKKLPSLMAKTHVTVLDLLEESGRVVGAEYLDEPAGCVRAVRSGAVLLATGGLGQVFAETTNPPAACGDGVALAFRAGALVSDMEFVQFHPTVLAAPLEPRLMLPLALREKGAHLRNLELERFMPRYHDAGDIAPADVVARAIRCEMEKERSSFVYLDLTGLDRDDVKRRFPQVYAACLEQNIDITSDLVPIRPAAHFAMGGIATDEGGSTSVPGLYAAGEAACTGVHGANRLANNALLECLVFGGRAAQAMRAGGGAAVFPAPAAGTPPFPRSPTAGPEPVEPAAARAKIRRIMWENAGVIRRGDALKKSAALLNSVAIKQPDRRERRSVETANLLEVARLILHCAAAREESRGAHYRADFPLRNGSAPPRHSFASRDRSVYFHPGVKLNA